MVCVYLIVGVGYVIFFAKDVPSAFDYIRHIVSPTQPWTVSIPGMSKVIDVLAFALLLAEWPMRNEEYALAKIREVPWRAVRWFVYLALVVLIMTYRGDFSEFIYFQF